MLQFENKIEDYLDGLLSSEEQQTFEDAMKNDKALANKVAIVKEINHTIATEGKLKNFKKTLEPISNAHFPNNQKKETTKETVIRPIKNNRKMWLIAASFLVLVVSSVLIWNVLKSETVDATELFAANYEPFNVNQRGENNDLTDIEKQALETYNAKDFAAAIPLLEQLSTENTTDEQLILQLGSAYLSTKQVEKAIAIFQKINTESVNCQAAQWYLALAYLQNDEIEIAKKILETLANSGERTYPVKAKKLLEAL
jgi:tetratricopeptide (TPR) repeat protein